MIPCVLLYSIEGYLESWVVLTSFRVGQKTYPDSPNLTILKPQGLLRPKIQCQYIPSSSSKIVMVHVCIQNTHSETVKDARD